MRKAEQRVKETEKQLRKAEQHIKETEERVRNAEQESKHAKQIEEQLRKAKQHLMEKQVEELLEQSNKEMVAFAKENPERMESVWRMAETNLNDSYQMQDGTVITGPGAADARAGDW